MPTTAVARDWTAWLLGGYILVVGAATLALGVSLTPDLFLVFAAAAALFLGRGWGFVRDWVPFVGIFIAWQAARGISHQHLGMDVQSDSIIALERAVFLGRIPAEVLQRWFYVPGQISPLDIGATLVYKAHFWMPFIVGFWIWIRARADFHRFAVTLLVLSLAAFATALLIPVAPPRFSAQYGEALAVTDIARALWAELSWTTTWLYQQLNGNPVAAMPSLHAAYPALVALFLRERWPRGALAMILWSAVVWFAIAYLGHHYLVDAIVGVAYAVGAYLAVRMLWSRVPPPPGGPMPSPRAPWRPGWTVSGLPSPTRPVPVAAAVLAVASLVVGSFLYQAGHSLVFAGGEWELAAVRNGWSIENLLAPWHGALAAVPIGLYNVLFEWKGLTTYNHYIAMLIGAHLLAVWVLFLVGARRSVVVALAAAAVLMTLGAAADVVLWPLHVGVPVAVAAGLASWYAWDADEPAWWRDAAGAASAVVALAAHPVGLVIVVAAATLVAASGRRFRLVWPAAVGVVVVAWLVGFGWSAAESWLGTVGSRPDDVVAGVQRLAGSLGLVGSSLALPVVVAVAVVAGIALRRGFRPSRQAWIAAAAALTVPLVTDNSSGVPDAALYASTALALVAAAELARDAPSLGPRWPRGLLAGAGLWLTVVVLTGLMTIATVASERRVVADRTRATLIALDLVAHGGSLAEGAQLDPTMFGDLTYGDWLRVRERLATPVTSTSGALLGRSADARAAADRAIVRVIPTSVAPGRMAAPPGRAEIVAWDTPAVFRMVLVDRTEEGCDRYLVGTNDPSVEITVPHGGRVFFRSDGSGFTQIYARLASGAFQEPASLRHDLVPDGWYVVGPPPAPDGLQWRLRVDPPALATRLEVCVAGPSIPPPFGLDLRPIATGLRSPVAVTGTGDGSGRMVAIERAGRIVRLEPGSEPTVLLDIRERVTGDGEQGLLGIAFHPGFATNGRVFLSYTHPDGNLRIVETDLAGGPERLLIGIPRPSTQHNAGALAFGPDGYLYAASGDGFYDRPTGQAGTGQDPDSRLGVLLRIDVDHSAAGQPYAIPPDNPRLRSRSPDVWAFGLRNPWRFSFDRQTGDLWIGDVGQREREEINFLPAGAPGGANLGWSIMEGTACYFAATCDEEGLTPPVAEYFHDHGNCAVTGGYVYRGHAYPELQGWYLFADFCSGRIWGMHGPDVQPLELLRSGRLIVSFGEDDDGELYVVAFDGEILRVELE